MPELNSTKPVQLEVVDFLSHKLAVAEHSRAQLVVHMCMRELEHAQIALNKQAHELGQLTKRLAEEYAVDPAAMIVSDDGYFMPRPPDTTQLLQRLSPR
jgi:hypothetical protein